MQIFSEMRDPVGLCRRQMMRSGSLRTSAVDRWPTPSESSSEVNLRDEESVLQPAAIAAAVNPASISIVLFVFDAFIDIALSYNFSE